MKVQKHQLNTKKFIKLSKLKHGSKYIYNNTKYKNAKTNVKIICKLHGEFDQRASSHLHGHGCKKCAIEYTAKIKILNRNGQNCKNCNKLFHFHDADKKKGRKFCSRKCYESFINIRPKKCKKCKKLFQPKRPPQKFCTINCLSKSNILTKEYVVDRFKLKHGNTYNYENLKYFGMDKKVKIKCKNHGFFYQKAADHQNGRGCDKCGEEIRILGTTLNELKKLDLNLKGKLYILECFSKKEKFYKIGFTKNSVKYRYHSKNQMPYEYEILMSIELGAINAYSYEQKILNLLSEYKYVPSKYFGGSSECLSVNPIEFSKDLNLLSQISLNKKDIMGIQF